MDDKYYYLDLAEAFARGRLGAPASASREEVLAQAQAAGLSLHRFKRTSGLPRVARVLGMLREIQPAEVLDIGSGRVADVARLEFEDGSFDVVTILEVIDRHSRRRLLIVHGGPVYVNGDVGGKRPERVR